MPARVLRHIGREAAVIDPRWDFEDDGGDPEAALRLFRTRAFVAGAAGSGKKPVRVRLLRHAPGAEPELLETRGHVFVLRGASEADAASWAMVDGESTSIEPPSAMFAVDLSRLGPAEHELVVEVPGAPKVGKDLRFRVMRRPFCRFAGALATARGAPRVRSATGLVELGARDAAFTTAHAWAVERMEWTERPPPAWGYDRRVRLDVVAVTLFGPDLRPRETRWRATAAGESPAAALDLAGFSTWKLPCEHQLPPEGGMGLPFPTLVGLPAQPSARGTYGKRAVTSA